MEANDAQSRRELDALREPPTGPKPAPPPRTALLELPFESIEWPDFEKLCERLVELEGEPEHVSRFGDPGQDQEGIDIYARLAGGGYVVYQCKRYQRLYPAIIRNAVSEFLDNAWSTKAARFVLCTSQSVVETSLAKEVEAQADRLRGHSPPIVLETWDRERLSRMLKSHPDLVEDFFGQPYVELFSPGGAGRAVEAASAGAAADLAAALQDVLRASERRVVIATLAWAPELLKTLLERLAEEDQAAFLQLHDLVGDPPDIELVLSNIATPAAWLGDAAAPVWKALALMAEQRGEWLPSSIAWESAGERESDDYAAAGSYVSAGASAHVGGDDDRRETMLSQARERFGRHPRLVLEEVRDLPPQEQLDTLATVELRDEVDVALVSAQQALACLLLPESVDRAEAFAAKAAEALPGNLGVRSIAVNISVQRARLYVIDGRTPPASALRQDNRVALGLRDELLRQRRWEESGRLLMLAADALSLQGEFASARDLLLQATSDELAAPDGADVLGNAALRTLGPREALKLTEGAPLTEGIRRIRATATLEAGAPAAARLTALAELDALVAEGGPEASEAAFARLVDAMEHGGWSDAAQAQLEADGHEGPALLLRAFYLGGRHASWEEAYDLLSDYPDTRWRLAARLRVAAAWGRHSVLRVAADELMAIGPGQVLKFECGQAYERIGALPRAREVLAQVAEDDEAPGPLRANAYALLVRVVGPRLEDWAEADRLLRNWISVRPGDTRASALAPIIARRRAATRRPG